MLVKFAIMRTKKVNEFLWQSNVFHFILVSSVENQLQTLELDTNEF